MVYKAILQQYNEVPKSRENSGLTGKNFTYYAQLSLEPVNLFLTFQEIVSE